MFLSYVTPTRLTVMTEACLLA